MNLFLEPGYRFPDADREKARAELQSNPKFKNWKLVQSLIYDALPSSLVTAPTATQTAAPATPSKRKPPTRAKKLGAEAEPTGKHYSATQLAAEWGVSAEMIRQLFREEPGVLKLGTKQKYKRGYVSIRIPKDVADRVYRKLSS